MMMKLKKVIIAVSRDSIIQTLSAENERLKRLVEQLEANQAL